MTKSHLKWTRHHWKHFSISSHKSEHQCKTLYLCTSEQEQEILFGNNLCFHCGELKADCHQHLCLGYILIVMIEHHDQINLQKKKHIGSYSSKDESVTLIAAGYLVTLCEKCVSVPSRLSKAPSAGLNKELKFNRGPSQDCQEERRTWGKNMRRCDSTARCRERCTLWRRGIESRGRMQTNKNVLI